MLIRFSLFLPCVVRALATMASPAGGPLTPGPSDTGAVALDVQTHAFFHNYELTNRIEPGYTLTGFTLEPRLAYTVSPRARVSAGAHMLYYSGDRAFRRATPVLTLEARLLPQFTLLIGTLPADGRHELPRAVFDRTRWLERRPEQGLQLMAGGRSAQGQAWINWEQFIHRGDSVQEEFTVGLTGRALLIHGPGLTLELSAFALAVHRGGQINVNRGDPVSTLANLGPAVQLTIPLGVGWSMGFQGVGVWGRDLSPTPHHVYRQGWGIQPIVFVGWAQELRIELGYWQAHRLILPRGMAMFGSQSTVHPGFNRPRREHLIGHVTYGGSVAQGFEVRGWASVWHDLPASLTEYGFGVTAIFTRQFTVSRRRLP